MEIRAVRTPDQDVLSSVMRRYLIDSVSPLISLDRKSNPLTGSTNVRKLNRLLKKFGLNVRELLAGLSDGKISIRDSGARTVKILNEIHKDGDADGKFLKKLSQMIHDIQIKMDSTAANVRRLMRMGDEGPLPAATELSNGDAALLSLIEAAREQISSAAEYQDVSPQRDKPPTPPPAKHPTEHPKSLKTIKDSGGKPVKDHPEYGPILAKFLESKGITDTKYPQMIALYRLLANLPLGQNLNKAAIAAKLNIKDGAVSALLNRLKEKNLHLNRGELPTTPGFFIRIAEGRAPAKQDSNGKFGSYLYELVMAVEE